MKKKLQKIGKAALFCVLLVGIFTWSSKVFTPKWVDEFTPTSVSVGGFYEQPENSVDVLFLGSCNIYNNVNPLTLWDEYGFTSYDFTCPDQEIWTSYAYLKEAYKSQTPKVVVLDALMLVDRFSADEAYQRQSLDYLPFSLNKLEAIHNTIQETGTGSYFEYLFPLFRYHDRWEELDKTDLTYQVGDYVNILKGGAPAFRSIEFTGNLDYMEPQAESSGVQIKESSAKYLQRIKTLCERNGSEFLLIKTPTALSWNYEQYQLVQDLADELGISYIDYNLYLDEIGIDWMTDSLSSGGARLNYVGMEKFSSYLGQDIVEAYALPPQTDPVIQEDWDKTTELYDSYKALYSLTEIEDIKQYLEQLELVKDDSLILMSVRGESSWAIDESIQAGLYKLGLKESLREKHGWSYLNVIDTGDVLTEAASASALQYVNRFSEDLAISMVSQGDQTGEPTVSIEINGDIASIGLRGLNIVVFDKRRNIIVDSVCFDTYLEGIPCIR